jgi:predicted RNA methylase
VTDNTIRIRTPDGEFLIPHHCGNFTPTGGFFMDTQTGQKTVSVFELNQHPTDITRIMPKLGTKPVPAEIRAILASLEWEDGCCRITAQLDRPTYVAVNKVLEAAKGKWDKKRKVHVFEDTDAELLIRTAAETGQYLDEKVAFQFFETPMPVAADLARTAIALFDETDSDCLLSEARVLDPSAGTGNLLFAMEAAGCGKLYAHDINGEYLNKLKKRLPFAGVSACDFLQLAPPSDPAEMFDVVIMNPPFSRQTDVRHVMHALDFVRDGGVLVAIMSPSWTFRNTTLVHEFREKTRPYATDFTFLPTGAFKESGTMIQTGVFSLIKKRRQ